MRMRFSGIACLCRGLVMLDPYVFGVGSERESA